MNTRSTEKQHLDTLRISDREWRMMVSQMNRRPKGDGTEQREDERSLYTAQPLIRIDLTHPGGSPAKYLVRPNDLSAGGMSFLHGQFLYPGTVVEVELTDIDGETIFTPGEIVYCRLLRGMTHEVGIRFDSKIDLQHFSS